MIQLPTFTGPLFVIGGPCVIESADICLTIAQHLKHVCEGLELSYVFKASFDKANRSSSASFRGPGIEEGLAILARVREEAGVPVLTDVHEVSQVEAAARVVDVLQVPAFLARQTDLLLACGRTDRWVNIKKGQFMAPAEMRLAVEKVRSARSAGSELKVLLTERGTFFGYGRLVNDFTGIPIMKETGCPVVFDATHSTQHPAAGPGGQQSGGSPQYIPLLARAAIAAGADGLFLETHPDPRSAKSDPATMLPLEQAEVLLRQCKAIAGLRKSWS